MTEVKSKVKIIKRLNNSTNGNPRYLLLIGDDCVETKSDASYCYNLENLVRKECVCICKIYSTKKGTLKLNDIEEDLK